LIKFILKFRNIYKIDFYADTLTSTLLRRIYTETEKVEEPQFSNLDEDGNEIE